MRQGGRDPGFHIRVQGVVDAADLTQDPPQVTIAGQSFSLNQIKRVVRPGA